MIVYNFLGKNCLLEKSLKNQQPFIDKLQEFNISYNKICFLNQVHSNEVAVIESQKTWQDLYQNNLPRADALVSNQKNIILAVITADCVPILLFDEKNQVISAVHAGYKGAKNNILGETLKKMQNLGANINNISAVIGPCIRTKSYQVSAEFYNDSFWQKNIKEKFFTTDPFNSDKFLFNLPGYTTEQLTSLGIKNIKDTNIDTYSNPHLYCSYRRCTHLQIPDCGRNISFISSI